MKFTRNEIIRDGLIIAVIVAILIYPAQIVNVLQTLYNASLPLVIGAALGYCINLLSSRLERVLWPHASNKFAAALRRPLAILLALALIALVITGVLRLVLPQFIEAINGFLTNLPSTLNKLNHWLSKSDQAAAITKQLHATQINWSTIQAKIVKYVSSGVSGVFSSAVTVFGSVTSGVISFILSLTFAIYLVGGKERIAGHINRVADAFLPVKILNRTRYVLRVANTMFSSFIMGQVVDALIIGTLCVLGMLLFNFPYALPIGALIGMTALIPMLGAWIGGTIGFVLIFVSSPLQAVFFLIYIIVLQQLEGNLVYPRVVGGTIGLPGIMVLAAITIGGGLYGVVGMLLSVPLTATVYRLVRNATVKKEQENAEADSESIE
jgi:predicted PurR-regulated permease PerM